MLITLLLSPYFHSLTLPVTSFLCLLISLHFNHSPRLFNFTNSSSLSFCPSFCLLISHISFLLSFSYCLFIFTHSLSLFLSLFLTLILILSLHFHSLNFSLLFVLSLFLPFYVWVNCLFTVALVIHFIKW